MIEHVSPQREMPRCSRPHPDRPVRQPRASSAGCARSLAAHPACRTTSARFERKRERRLYVTACDLDTAERVDLRRRRELRASRSRRRCRPRRALPIFYKPARINGVDYVDGGVRHTANIDVAIEKGADLDHLLQPVPPVPEPHRRRGRRQSRYFADGRYLSDRGLGDRAEPGVPHAAPLAAQARPPALPRRRPLPRRHRAARAARAATPTSSASTRSRSGSARDAIQHGFESVRTHDRAELRAAREPCSAATASQLDRDAAKRKAEKLRSSRGWKVTEPAPPEPPQTADERPSLRLVQG